MLKHERAVLFEDENSVTKFLKRECGKAKVELLVIDPSRRGHGDFIDELVAFAPHVAIVDFSLEGGISGVHLLRYVREQFPSLPIVLISGQLDNPEKAEPIREIGEKVGNLVIFFGKKPLPKWKLILQRIEESRVK